MFISRSPGSSNSPQPRVNYLTRCLTKYSFSSFFFGGGGGHIHGMWKFLGSNLPNSSYPDLCSDNARSLTPCAVRELWKYCLLKFSSRPSWNHIYFISCQLTDVSSQSPFLLFFLCQIFKYWWSEGLCVTPFPFFFLFNTLSFIISFSPWI